MLLQCKLPTFRGGPEALDHMHNCPASIEGRSGALPHPCGQWPLGAAQWLLWGHLVHDIWFVSFCKGAGKFEWWPHPKPMVAAHPFQLTPPKWGCVGKSMARARECNGAKGLKHHPLGVQPAQMPPNALPHGGTPHGQRSQVGVSSNTSSPH